jgi:hypothetical protein
VGQPPGIEDNQEGDDNEEEDEKCDHVECQARTEPCLPVPKIVSLSKRWLN